MQLRQILERSTSIERKLESLGAVGKGLHEKATSVASQLDAQTLKKIRFIASIRNKVVHESVEVDPEVLRGFFKACDAVDASIGNYAQPPQRFASSDCTNSIDIGNSWDNMSTAKKTATAAIGIGVVGLFAWAYFNDYLD